MTSKTIMATAAKKENSVVRFAKGTATHGSRPKHMYRPELHRQVTERAPVSPLGRELTQLCQAGLGEALDPVARARAVLELGEVIDKIATPLKRNRAGLDMKAPIILHCFPHWHVAPQTTVVCLLPVTFAKVKVIQKDAGHLLLKLPPAPKPDSQPSLNTPREKDKQQKLVADTRTTKDEKVPVSPRERDQKKDKQQNYEDVRTKDGVHVSPRKLHAACAKLLTKALVVSQLGGVLEKDRVQVSLDPADPCVTLNLECGWTAELVPCVTSPPDGDAGVHYVTRPFTAEIDEKESISKGEGGCGGDITWRPWSAAKEHDLLSSISNSNFKPFLVEVDEKGRSSRGEGGSGGHGDIIWRPCSAAKEQDLLRSIFNSETHWPFTTEIDEKGISSSRSSGGSSGGGDITWRPCSAAKEHGLLRSISSSDGGLRTSALHVVCRLTSRDWRLEHLTCHHVQTALLHDMDFQVDFSPRWQRCGLETGVTSLLRTLLYFVDRESLPHFHFNQLNLWDGVTARQMTQARGALNRLLDNENALISLVRRASSETVVSVDLSSG